MIQRGKNNKYPEQIEIWKLGNKVPEWLSDICKVDFVDGEGNLTLNLTETTTGGYELKTSDGKNTLIVVNNKKDYICYCPGTKIFVLSEAQLNLLYK